MITFIDKDTIDFLAKKKLTFNQFCMCLLIHQGDVAGILKYTAEVGFITGGTILKPDRTEVKELDDLLVRGYLKHDNIDKGDWYSLDNFTVTEKFTKNFLDQFDFKAKEFWDQYPVYMRINNEDKPYGRGVDYEEYKEKYIKILREDIHIHEKLMSIIQESKKKSKYAELKILNFIGSRPWENNAERTAKLRIH
jgi:hypothetical protein